MLPYDALSWDDGDGIFDDTDKNDHMDYTDDMRALRKAFRKKYKEEKDAVYVFLISGAHKTNLAGYMPLKGKYGFIFTQSQSQDETAHTIAHEIGHGAFHLRHTFSPKNEYVLSQNTTDNLMDYAPGGKALNKYQWDQIHDPENLQFAWLENEEEGELISIKSLLELIHDANKNEYNLIRISQDKCPHVCYKDLKLNNEFTINLLQINCSKKFENTKINPGLFGTMIDWTATLGPNVNIRPSEKTKVYAETNAGKRRYKISSILK